jgi:hypothetical protein
MLSYEQRTHALPIRSSAACGAGHMGGSLKWKLVGFVPSSSTGAHRSARHRQPLGSASEYTAREQEVNVV